MSYLSPWDRASSDPNLSPPSQMITGKRHSRRQLIPQCQFKSSISNNGDLEFRPEYREAFVAHPPDACASPRHTRRRHQQQNRARCSTVEGVDLVKPEASLVGTEEEDGTKQSQLVNEESADQSLLLTTPRTKSAVYPRRQSTPNLYYDTESHSQFQYIPLSIEDRVKLLRRATTLHLEGDQYFEQTYKSSFLDSPRKRHVKPLKPIGNIIVGGEFYPDTEVNSQFLPYIIVKRSELKRHHTQLHIEGDMHIDPEYRASFIEFPIQHTDLIKPRENLKVTGPGHIMIGVSEQREKYSSVPLSPRPEIVIRPTNLQVGGGDLPEETRQVLRRQRPATVHADFASPSVDVDTTPEYRSSYRDFPRKRPETLKPAGTLSSDGPWLGRSPEYRSAFTDFPRTRPEIRKQSASLKPFGGVNDSLEYRESYKDFPRKRPQLNKPIQNLKPEGILMATSPEYKEKYQNFPRQRPDIKKATETLKPEGDFTDKNSECKENYKDSPRMRPKVIKPSSSMKIEHNDDKMDKSPEYKEEYKDFPRQRPRINKPIQHLRPEGQMFEKKAEYHESYVDFPRQRPEMTRPEGNLRSDGPWLGRFPEYRAAFIDLPRHRPVLRRPAEGLSTPDALGGGYEPSFDGATRSDLLLRPKSATSPRSLSPAGVATGAPKHNKRRYYWL